MPYVNIRIAGSLSREQKKKIALEITDTLERIAHKPKSYTYIAIFFFCSRLSEPAIRILT